MYIDTKEVTWEGEMVQVRVATVEVLKKKESLT